MYSKKNENKEKKGTMPNKKLEAFVVGSVRKLYEKKVLGEIKVFSNYRMNSAIKKIFLYNDVLNIEKQQSIMFVASKFYIREKRKWVSKDNRYNKNEKLNELAQRYKGVDVILMAKVLMLKGKFSLQSSKDFEILEFMIRTSKGLKNTYNF